MTIGPVPRSAMLEHMQSVRALVFGKDGPVAGGPPAPATAVDPVLDRLTVLEAAVAALYVQPTILVKKIVPEARVPSFAHPGDAGADVFALERVLVPPGELRTIRTGLSFAVPEGYEMQIRPRSGLAKKHGLTVLNSPGTLDAGYRGPLQILLFNHGKEAYQVEEGEAVAQVVIGKLVGPVFAEVPELSQSARGEGGFGSTGKRNDGGT